MSVLWFRCFFWFLYIIGIVSKHPTTSWLWCFFGLGPFFIPGGAHSSCFGFWKDSLVHLVLVGSSTLLYSLVITENIQTLVGSIASYLWVLEGLGEDLGNKWDCLAQRFFYLPPFNIHVIVTCLILKLVLKRVKRSIHLCWFLIREDNMECGIDKQQFFEGSNYPY